MHSLSVSIYDRPYGYSVDCGAQRLAAAFQYNCCRYVVLSIQLRHHVQVQLRLNATIGINNAPYIFGLRRRYERVRHAITDGRGRSHFLGTGIF